MRTAHRTRRPRRIPPTLYPQAAELAYFRSLKREIDAWFKALAEDLLNLPDIRRDGVEVFRLDVAAPLPPLSRAEYANLIASVVPRFDAPLDDLLGGLQDLRATAARAAERNQQQVSAASQREASNQVDAVMDRARDRWRQAEDRLTAGLQDLGQSVNRISERSIQRQIEAALSDRRLAEALAGQYQAFPGIQHQVDQFTRANASLIKDIGEKAARDVEALTQSIVSRGGSAGELAQMLQHRLGVTQTRAALIASNQVSRLNTGLTKAQAVAAGFGFFVWERTSSAHPRSDHLSKVGKTFSWSAHPLPGEEPNCKCSARPVLSDEQPGDPKLEPTPQDKRILERLKTINTLHAFEREAAKLQNIEVFGVFDAQGKKLFQGEGRKGEVDMSVLQTLRARDCTITHNHPSGTSFSSADLALAAVANAREIRVSGYFGQGTDRRFVKYSARRKTSASQWVDGLKTARELPQGQVAGHAAGFAGQLETYRNQLKPGIEQEAEKLIKSGKLKAGDLTAYLADEQAKALCEVLNVIYRSRH